jgi:hypothetical protein
MMEAARTSQTPVETQLRKRQYIPEDSELHTRRRENFKSHTGGNYKYQELCASVTMHILFMSYVRFSI